MNQLLSKVLVLLFLVGVLVGASLTYIGTLLIKGNPQTITVERVMTNEVIRWRTNTIRVSVGTNIIIPVPTVSIESNLTDAAKWGMLVDDTIPRSLVIDKTTNDNMLIYAYRYNIYDPVSLSPVHALCITQESEYRYSIQSSGNTWVRYAVIGASCLATGCAIGYIIGQ